MNHDEARAVLGVEAGASPDEVRAAFRSLVRAHHPDIAGPGPGRAARAREILDAYAALRDGAPPPAPPASTPARDADVTEAQPSPSPPSPGPGDRRGQGAVAFADDGSVHLAVPGPEAMAALIEAGSRIATVAYLDRSNGILELIVRFDGGPTCSVLCTLQGRAHGTEVFCTMDSIEAAPTPSIAPVLDALAASLGDVLAPSEGDRS